jgi:hypothetical protein
LSGDGGKGADAALPLEGQQSRVETPPHPSPAEKKKPQVSRDAEPAAVPAPAPIAEPPTARSNLADVEQAKSLWSRAMQQISGMTGDFGNAFTRLAISAPNHLVVELKTAYNKEWCERPDVKKKIEETLGQLAGGEIRVTFQAAPEPAGRPQPVETAASRMQRARRVESHPLVQDAMELFDAEVVRFDEKRGG